MAGADNVSKVVAHFEEQILSGRWRRATCCRRRRAIASDMEVGRNVVREAIGRLASLGLVSTVHGSGTRSRGRRPADHADL